MRRVSCVQGRMMTIIVASSWKALSRPHHRGLPGTRSQTSHFPSNVSGKLLIWLCLLCRLACACGLPCGFVPYGVSVPSAPFIRGSVSPETGSRLAGQRGGALRIDKVSHIAQLAEIFFEWESFLAYHFWLSVRTYVQFHAHARMKVPIGT